MKIQVCERCKGSVTEDCCTCAVERARLQLEQSLHSAARQVFRAEDVPMPVLARLKAAIRRCLPSDARGGN